MACKKKIFFFSRSLFTVCPSQRRRLSNHFFKYRGEKNGTQENVEWNQDLTHVTCRTVRQLNVKWFDNNCTRYSRRCSLITKIRAFNNKGCGCLPFMYSVHESLPEAKHEVSVITQSWSNLVCVVSWKVIWVWILLPVLLWFTLREAKCVSWRLVF